MRNAKHKLSAYPYFRLKNYVGHKASGGFELQWNPVSTATNGPEKFGRINGVAVITA